MLTKPASVILYRYTATNFLFPADDDGSDFLRNLLKCGSSLPVDSDVDAYELQLPEWYDDGKFKRYDDNIGTTCDLSNWSRFASTQGTAVLQAEPICDVRGHVVWTAGDLGRAQHLERAHLHEAVLDGYDGLSKICGDDNAHP